MAFPISLSLSKLHFLPNPKQIQFSFTHKDPNFISSTRKKTHYQ
ncbi:hypothetical protein RDI58_019253 [Solanum bulbocastanum]|uniref:Uncharacterized protein n=1 Tax=Solanum bulbocastanum TaxID=147425 RepID=A0AAN8TA61_SOLBU